MHLPKPIALLPRLVALLGVGLVLVLAIGSVSPEAHHWFHDAHHEEGAQSCAFVLISSGIALEPNLEIVPPLPRAVVSFRVPVAQSALMAPEHLLPPGRGPPYC